MTMGALGALGATVATTATSTTASVTGHVSTGGGSLTGKPSSVGPWKLTDASRRQIMAWAELVVDPPLACQTERRTTWTPERALCAAVLCEALDALIGRAIVGTPNHVREREKAQRDARRWIVDGADVAPYAFVRVCAWLGLDEARVRTAALADDFATGWRRSRWFVKRFAA